jgi:hypothetical protein
MWTGHYAPALILKTIVPEVPLSFLCLASTLPDLLAFFMAITGFGEYFVNAPSLPGAFRFHTAMPLTHSLEGNVILALSLALGYYLYSNSQLGATAMFLACLSHFPLELPGHRQDLRIYPTDTPSLGYGMFDSSILTFWFEGLVIGTGFYYYLKNTIMDVGVDRSQGDMFTKIFGLVLAFQHVVFSFSLSPMLPERYGLAPLFILQILLTASLAHIVDWYRVTHGSVLWDKVAHAKREVSMPRSVSGIASK